MLTHRSIRREVGCSLARFLFLSQRSQRDTKPKTNLESPINLSPLTACLAVNQSAGQKPRRHWKKLQTMHRNDRQMVDSNHKSFCSKAQTLKYCQHVNLFIHKLKYFYKFTVCEQRFKVVIQLSPAHFNIERALDCWNHFSVFKGF